MQPVKYSVIITVYNAEKTLRSCVDSVVHDSENVSEIEVILVNDGSTDHSFAICEEYAQLNNNIIAIDKPNGGVASARNEGLNIARGEYILFVDSDDRVAPGYFSAIDESGDADAVVFGMQKCGKESVEELLPINNLKDLNFDEYLIRTRDGGPCNKRFKRQIIVNAKIRFPEDLNVGEDFIFCLEYSLRCNKLCLIDRILYDYDVSAVGSLTRKFRPDYVEQALKIYEYAFDIVGASCKNDDYKSKLMNILDYNYCRTAFACAAIPIKYKDVEKLSVKDEISFITKSFSAHLPKNTSVLGLPHCIMRICLKLKISFSLFVIGKLWIKWCE